MRVGVGLPSTVPGANGALVIEWARRADAGPFSSLGVLDRLVYDSYDPLTALAAAAAVTQRVLLATTIIIGPLHNDALLAKMAASIEERLSEQLSTLRALWEDGSINPTAARSGGPQLLVGGLSNQGFARVARYADGYVHGGGPPRAFARAADKVRAAWYDAGRPGKPQFWAQGYFALGNEHIEAAGTRYLTDYYAFTGPFAERIAAGLLTSPQAIAQFMRGYEEAGCDELVLFPTVPDLDQLEQLADILNGLGRKHPHGPRSVDRIAL